MTEIRPRIIGSETEWAITSQFAGKDNYQQLDGAKQLIQKLPNGVDGTNWSSDSRMLTNGARYYSDIGDHLEYATPEDTSFESMVAGEIAGERLVIESMRQFFEEQEKIAMLKLNKRVVDDAGTTWAYHMNLSADRKALQEAGDKLVRTAIGVHLASSLPMLGAGALLKPKHLDAQKVAPQFRFSQKIGSLSYDVANSTTNNAKPLVNNRDEPHAESSL